ncbi:PREDICTED: uncharacterized protein LOC104599019 isoform X2 [Nelumbo nucifera]|uniref:Uncharacterized protein LOC104599019 isoform X2 n=1 Tax=Nelumbo nucifera TaxID=4432 RepID=A0A1U8Q403_NELNU|nr:PREDICTED: uncharacterized protein LOC104599019 isoform X2 [Nelumbo nucifera]
MWRQNCFSENEDSDQSISDGEDPEDEKSLCRPERTKDQLPVLSQLETLKECERPPGVGIDELGFGREKSWRSFQKHMGASFEESELPGLHDGKGENAFAHKSYDEERISDDEDYNMVSKFSVISGANKFQKDHLHILENENKNESCIQSAVLKEANKFLFSHKEDGNYSFHTANSETRKIWKGRSKVKPRFSIRHWLHKEATPPLLMMKDEDNKSSSVPKLYEGLGNLEHKVMGHSMTELLEGLQEEKETQSDLHLGSVERVTPGHGNLEHSMTEFLNGFQGQNCELKRTYKMNSKTKGRKLWPGAKRNISHLGDRILQNEELHELIISETSSEDEANDQNQLKLTTVEIKGQTMADRFQEALIASAATEGGSFYVTSKKIGTGYYGRLQQVMQAEKERHMEFLKQVQTSANSHDAVGCIDVKILSRYLDAKLTVCQCTVGENTKSLQCAQNLQGIKGKGDGEKTIIFSSKFCGNVELEVGNLIRIHPPWKEVKSTGSGSIILCTYFSQIET